MSENQQQNTQQNSGNLLQVRRDKLKDLQEMGKNPFDITTSDRNIHNADVVARFDELENQDVCIAGRVMSKRGKGKVSFLDVHDITGKMQIFAKFDDLGEESYNLLKKWDIGDIVEIKGFVFKTKVGEISVHAKEAKL